MNKWSKLGITAGMCTTVLASIHLINKLIFKTSTSSKLTFSKEQHVFNWKFGNMSYTTAGHGSPILLIHDLQPESSSYEWNKSIALLAQNHTVYAIDLIGCGNSDKPNITYTTYMYTQLINDFILNVISKKVSVIATGSSVPLTLMAAYNNSYLFDKIILVNPEGIKTSMINPGKRSRIRRHIINSPIIGTLIYNICMSKRNIYNNMHNNMAASNPNQNIVNIYHENAHLAGSSSKFLYSSIDGHYTTASISQAVAQLDNCIFIISGKKEPNADSINAEYTALNPAIETIKIDFSKHLPQYEQPADFVKTVKLFLG